MNMDILQKNDIFLIPIGDYLYCEKSAYYIVYSPLKGRMLAADNKGLEQLHEIIPELVSDLQADDLLSKVEKASDLQKMSVLPNHTCNFNCSYCYSAKGRSNTTLQYDVLDKALEYFIDPQRLKERHLSLSFIGGGEPLLSWPLVKHGIEYADFLASRYGFSLFMTITTNGSIMNDSIIDVLSQYCVLPNVSFDILEEAQNKHRKHFLQVCKTLDKLCEKGLIPVVNATITPDSVERMQEMFDFMNEHFPLITDMVFEPVVSNEIFTTPQELGAFYDKYIYHFFRTRAKAKVIHKNITCRIFKNVDSLLERGCPSKLSLTPQGELSICYCVSSPKEKMYTQRVYGNVDTNGVHIDEEKFKRINEINIYSYPKCENCFAKWHCAGGCMCPNDLYGVEHLEEVCRFTKEIIRRTLFLRMEMQCKSEGFSDINEYFTSLNKKSEQ